MIKLCDNKSNISNNPQNTSLWVILVPFLIFVFFMLFTLNGCKKKEINPVSREAFLLDTFVTISIYETDSSSSKNINEILDNCIEKIENYESLFSRTISTSDIYKINNSNGIPVKVSEDTFELIEKGIYYGDISNGLFDITIARVSELWDFHEDSSPKIPDKTTVESLASHVSYKNIILNKNDMTVVLKDPLCAIDLGGLAKGYIADKIKEYLISENISSALINLGGNIMTIGSKPDHHPFRVGIKKPFSSGEIITDVTLNNNGIATSGIYERYFILNNKTFHHILDPKSGYPVDTDLYSVSVISESSIDSDALGTICVLLGKEKASEFIKQFSDANFIFIDSDYTVLNK